MSGYQPFPDPFADPSIAQATSKNQSNSPLEDYNPFASPGSQTKTTEPAVLPTNSLHGQIGSHSSSSTSTFPQPTLVPSNISASSSNPQSASQPLNHNELQRRQEELERKAAELAAKEEALRNLEGSVSRPHNWPPLPSFCPVGPCFYQDISVEIRPEFQKVVTYAYYLWILYFLVLLMNMVSTIVLEANHAIQNGMFASIIYVFAFVPLSFIGWFRPLYKAFRSDSSFNFMIFFFIFFCHLAFSVLFAIGTPNGTCGLLTVFEVLSSGFGLVLLSTFTAILLIAYAIATVLMMIKVHSIYKSTDASFAKAQEEFLSNQHVQSATQAAVQNATRHTMNNMFNANGQSQPSASRF